MRSLIVIFFFILFCASPMQAQSNQVWIDYTLNVPFANRYLFSTQFSYRTLDAKQNKWREVEINPTVQWSILNRVDLIAAFTASKTLQQDEYNTDELRPGLGFRYHFSPNKRVLLQALARMEQRNLYHEETSSWDHSARSRFRLESLIPINRKTMFENQLWYGVLDVEGFWVMDKQLGERYANQVRYRAGIGYRQSYSWRFEFIYTDQFTRNNLDAGFQEVSNIFRFRVKHFLNASKPVKKDTNDDN
jgi:hypothetical protein